MAGEKAGSRNKDLFLCNRKVLLLHKKPSGQEAHLALRKYGC